MATQLLYLEDFDVTTCAATVVAVQQTDDERTLVQLDETCFYPRGGGQDWDEGMIEGAGTAFAVEEVRLDEQGIVRHIGHFTSGEFTAGAEVACTVDAPRRELNTRLHSAGHVVDVAVDQLRPEWKPVRGAHYPHMSFVEYDGQVDTADAEALAQEIERIANDTIEQGADNEIRFMAVDEMATVCRHVSENIPTNKPARVVVYGGDFGVPCGGTHVRNVKNIGPMRITKVKTKKGLTKVSYELEGVK